MRLIRYIILFYHIFLCTSKNINECNKLWGMNNEINGVTVSNIGIYMCVDDPLNIYSSISKTKDIVLSNQQFDIQNFNETVQRKLNNTINDTILTTTTISPTITTTTESPTTTNTGYPGTTTVLSSTTESSTTTTISPTTTTTTESPTTTTESSTITTTLSPVITTKKYLRNPENETASLFENKNLNNISSNNNEPDIPLIIGLTVTVIMVCVCCIRCNPLIYECLKRKCKRLTEKKELRNKSKPSVKLDIKEKKVTPISIQTNKVNYPPQVITPKRKVSLGFNTMGNQEDWYKNTFKDELSVFKDVEPPSAPRIPTPKMPIPTLQANLNELESHVNTSRKINNKINNRMDHMIKDVESMKKEISLDNRAKNNNLRIREIGHVKQRVNSIEKRSKNPDFRNVRLNSWTR